MAEVELQIVENAAACAQRRTEDMARALERKPDLVFVGNAGRTSIDMYRRFGHAGLDLSRVRLRMLDACLLSPSRGVESPDHSGCCTQFVTGHILPVLAPDKRPRDWCLPPEDVATCEELANAMEEQPDAWNRLRHPLTGELGAELVVHEAAAGPLALVGRACRAYEDLLSHGPLDLVGLGMGPMPYPPMASNTGPYTRPDAPTHLTVLDAASREARGEDFGDAHNVPPFALTAGTATLCRSTCLWITAAGADKAEAVAWSLGDPSASDFEFRSSIGYALRAPRVSLLFDEAAAELLCEDGGLKGLARRYAAAGHRLVARRA